LLVHLSVGFSLFSSTMLGGVGIELIQSPL